jgi:hypothetical protein
MFLFFATFFDFSDVSPHYMNFFPFHLNSIHVNAVMITHPPQLTSIPSFPIAKKT